MRKTSSSSSSCWSLRQHTHNHNNNTGRYLLLFAALFCLGSFSLFPILVLESVGSSTIKRGSPIVSPDRLIADAVQNAVQNALHPRLTSDANKKPPPPKASSSTSSVSSKTSSQQGVTTNNSKKNPNSVQAPLDANRKKNARGVPQFELRELKSDSHVRNLPVARGVAGRPLDQTPAVQDAQRAHIECDINVDSLAYWNDPQGSRDATFQSPFRVSDPNRYYITFNPDPGGALPKKSHLFVAWLAARLRDSQLHTHTHLLLSVPSHLLLCCRTGWNNVRMSMEIIFVIAAATGRTLVLPPKAPLYLLHHAKEGESKHRGFADFYPIDTMEFQKRVKTISMEEFIQREGVGPNARFPIPNDHKDGVLKASQQCDKRLQADAPCDPLYQYLETVGSVPNVSAAHTCLVFDEKSFAGDEPSIAIQEYVAQQCGKSRQVVYWGAPHTDSSTLQHDAVLLHFDAAHRERRILAHFYSMIHFTNPATDHYYKRFVRDFLHYHDTIYCAAGKIVKAVQVEALARGFAPDPATGAGGFSSLHVRRGDLQYKRVKIPAKEWYENTKEVWLPKELLYVATDERDKSFFDDLAAHHDLRFLDDYWDFANLSALDGNYMGMIDTIVASRGRAFAGTWFSTFSGFINRMRGYHGMSMMDSWYSFLEKKEGVHQWVVIDDARYAFEWPDGWIGIDADEWPSKDKF